MQSRTAKPLGLLLLLVVAAVVLQHADAHGYVQSPPSRAYSCKLRNDARCGAVRYEPQSVEALKGFPASGPANGHIIGAGKFPDIDPQVPSWPTNAVKTGSNTFVWHLTAAHSTSQWRYFITRVGWNSQVPLTRSALEEKPFCTIAGNGSVPSTEVRHQCTIPSTHKGYHIVLAIWDIADTPNAFYQGIDLTIS